MSIYNISNVSGTNFYDMALGLSQLEPITFPVILVVGMGIIYTALATRFSFESSLLSALFVGSAASIYYSTLGLIATDFLVFIVAVTAALGGWAVIKARMVSSSV